jgi:transposase
MPIFHEVFDGIAAEAPTLGPTLKKVLARYPYIRRLVVADRGLLSFDSIEALAKLHVTNQRALEFI